MTFRKFLVISYRSVIKLKDLVESRNDISLMFEMPMRISSVNLNQFYEPSDNLQYAKKMREFGRKIGDLRDTEIYQISNDSLTFDAFLMGEFVVAYFEYEIHSDNVLIERKVWQDNAQLGLCRSIIFEHYLKLYDGIVSDGLHTDLGERYWKKLVDESIKRGCEVFTIKDGKTKIKIDSSKDMDKFYKSVSYRFLILKKK